MSKHQATLNRDPERIAKLWFTRHQAISPNLRQTTRPISTAAELRIKSRELPSLKNTFIVKLAVFYEKSPSRRAFGRTYIFLSIEIESN